MPCIPVTSLKPPQALLECLAHLMPVSIPGQKASVGMKRVSRAGSAEATRGTCAAAPDPKGRTSTMGKIDDDEGSPSGCVLAPAD